MPQASTIVLADGQATPVNHNFVPISVAPRQAIFVDRSSLTSAGNNQLILEFDPARAGRTTNHVRIRLNCPIEQTTDGITSVAYVSRFDGKAILPDQMTTAQRDNILAFIANAFSNAVVQGYISDLEPAF